MNCDIKSVNYTRIFEIFNIKDKSRSILKYSEKYKFLNEYLKGIFEVITSFYKHEQKDENSFYIFNQIKFKQ